MKNCLACQGLMARRLCCRPQNIDTDRLLPFDIAAATHNFLVISSRLVIKTSVLSLLCLRNPNEADFNEGIAYYDNY